MKKPDDRKQEADGRRQEVGNRRQEAESRKRKAESRRQKAGGRRQEAGGRKSPTDHWLWLVVIASSSKQGANPKGLQNIAGGKARRRQGAAAG
ncbi:MAG TPA: hypothetical protein VGL91_08485 [Acidobacteriota bacterium]